MSTIRLSKSSIGSEEIEAVTSVLTDEYLGMGSRVLEFEQNLTSLLGQEVVCVSSGTAALHLALEALGVKGGDQVLVPSLTYIASFQAISATGATPIACDVDRKGQLCLEDCKKKLNSSTKAIMPVLYAGSAHKYDDYLDFAVSHGVRCVNDAAHAFGSTRNNRLVGSYGDICCFSFDGIKNITSGEGGAIATEDKQVLEHIRNARLLGVINDSANRYKRGRSWDFNVEYQGWRYHMSDVMAAIGLEQLKKLDIFSEKRRSLAAYYCALLKESNAKAQPMYSDFDEMMPHIFPVVLDGSIKKRELREFLLSRDVQTGSHYKPNHLHTLYKGICAGLPVVSEEVYEHSLSLPLHVDLSEEDIRYVVSCLEEFCCRNQ